MRVSRVTLEPLHLGAFVDLHPVLDQQVLETLECRQRIDAVGSAVADAGGVILRAEDFLQLAFIVDPLVGEPDALAAFAFLLDGMTAVLAEPEEQRILVQQPGLDVVFLDGLHDALDAADGRLPDFSGGLDAVTADQLMEFELAVGSQHAGAATG